MPELPEVETIRRALEKRVLHQPIQAYVIFRDDFVQAGNHLSQRVKGKPIVSIQRRGKFLALHLESGLVLMHHLGMSGRLLLSPSSEERPHHTHVVITFQDGANELRHYDPRRFGFAALLEPDQLETFPSWAQLGPEPFDLEPPAFYAALQKSRQPVKNWLLNQHHIAGLGNIYADESLFRAGIHPLTPAGKIKRAKATELLKQIQIVLHEAIAAGGSSTNDFRLLNGQLGEFQHRHRVYRRHGETCNVCGQTIERIVVGNRGTHFCPKCQKPSRTTPREAKAKRGHSKSKAN